jgi:hypothetical protein
MRDANKAITRRSQQIKYDSAIPIRKQTIPIFMSRCDVVGIAEV